MLVSLYHYVLRYADEFADHPLVQLLALPPGGAISPLHAMEAKIAAYVREWFAADLDISICWLQSGRSYPVRSEDLWLDPVRTLRILATALGPVSRRQIARTVTWCDIDAMRERAGEYQKFFREAASADGGRHCLRGSSRSCAMHRPTRCRLPRWATRSIRMIGSIRCRDAAPECKRDGAGAGRWRTTVVRVVAVDQRDGRPHETVNRGGYRLWGTCRTCLIER